MTGVIGMKIVKMRDGSAVQIITEAFCRELDQTMVIYQELKDPFSVFALEQSQFRKMIEKTTKDEAERKEEEHVQPQSGGSRIQKAEQTYENDHASLMEKFLDADTYHKKIQILEGQEGKISEETMELLALTMDAVLEGNTKETRYYSLMQVLRTRARFEVER